MKTQGQLPLGFLLWPFFEQNLIEDRVVSASLSFFVGAEPAIRDDPASFHQIFLLAHAWRGRDWPHDGV